MNIFDTSSPFEIKDHDEWNRRVEDPNWSKRVANITLVVDRRVVNHDGYCSDAGEDEGEWEYDVSETHFLRKIYYDHINENNAIDENGVIDINFLKKWLDSDKMGCQCGSNYCGYEGSVIVKSGIIKII